MRISIRIWAVRRGAWSEVPVTQREASLVTRSSNEGMSMDGWDMARQAILSMRTHGQVSGRGTGGERW